jgi:hypothetical protein
MTVYKCLDCDYTDESAKSVAGHMLREHGKQIFDEDLNEYLEIQESNQSKIGEHNERPKVAPTHHKQKNDGDTEPSIVDKIKSILPI